MTQYKNKSKASDIAILGIFIAIMVIIHLLSRVIYSFWPFPIQPTLLHIPVIIGSIVLGWRKGAFLGFVMGMISFLNSTLAPIPTSFLFSPFVPNGNIWSLFIAFIPRIIVGILHFFIYKPACNNNRNSTNRLYRVANAGIRECNHCTKTCFIVIERKLRYYPSMGYEGNARPTQNIRECRPHALYPIITRSTNLF